MSENTKPEEVIIEEQTAPVAEEKAVEKKPEKKSQKKSKPDDFISRKLKVINTMNNPAKKMRLAERVLSNRKAVK